MPAPAAVLAPLLEETVFRGFLLATLTKWMPTPAAVLLSSIAFGCAHFTPRDFPQVHVHGWAAGCMGRWGVRVCLRSEAKAVEEQHLLGARVVLQRFQPTPPLSPAPCSSLRWACCWG